MGTWGSGNLDSDGTLDIVADRSMQLITGLWGRLQQQQSWEADESDHDELFVDFEMLFALESAGAFNGWGLPPVAELDPVCERWLAGWAEYFPGLGPSEEFMAERRGVIEDTFARFREICAKYEAQRSG